MSDRISLSELANIAILNPAMYGWALSHNYDTVSQIVEDALTEIDAGRLEEGCNKIWGIAAESSAGALCKLYEHDFFNTMDFKMLMSALSDRYSLSAKDGGESLYEFYGDVNSVVEFALEDDEETVKRRKELADSIKLIYADTNKRFGRRAAKAVMKMDDESLLKLNRGLAHDSVEGLLEKYHKELEDSERIFKTPSGYSALMERYGSKNQWIKIYPCALVTPGLTYRWAWARFLNRAERYSKLHGYGTPEIVLANDWSLLRTAYVALILCSTAFRALDEEEKNKLLFAYIDAENDLDRLESITNSKALTEISKAIKDLEHAVGVDIMNFVDFTEVYPEALTEEDVSDVFINISWHEDDPVVKDAQNSTDTPEQDI